MKFKLVKMPSLKKVASPYFSSYYLSVILSVSRVLERDHFTEHVIELVEYSLHFSRINFASAQKLKILFSHVMNTWAWGFQTT